MGEWISVEDRLPPFCEFVLCCGPKGGMYIGQMWDDDRTCGYWAWDQHRHWRAISHWMPLPEPPEEHFAGVDKKEG